MSKISDEEDTESSGEDLTIYSCPVDGCERTAINDSNAIRNHVLNLQDESHEGKVLNEVLELVDQYGDWSPGVPDEPPADAAPRESGYRVKSAAKVSW